MRASARMSRLGVGLLDSVDEFIGDVELYLDRTVKVDDADTFYRLRSIPGVGKILVRRRSPVDLILAFNAVFLALFLNRFSIVLDEINDLRQPVRNLLVLGSPAVFRCELDLRIQLAIFW